MRSPTFTIKLPVSIQSDIQAIQDTFGIPSERKTVESCIETIGRLILEDKLDQLFPYEHEGAGTDSATAKE